MASGIVIYDEETVGTFKTTEDKTVVISFDNQRSMDSALSLTFDNGLTLGLLAMPEDLEVGV